MPFRPSAGALGLPAADIGVILDGSLIADATILGIPFDGGVTALPGQRHGPELLRHYSPILPWTVDDSGALGGLLDPISECEILLGKRVFDIGDLGSVPIDPRIPRSAFYRSLDQIAERLARCVAAPIFIGGDHSVSGPIVAALARVYGPLHLLCFDAHLDYHAKSAAQSLQDITHADFLGHLLETGAVSQAEVYGVRTYLPADAGPLPAAITSSYALPTRTTGYDDQPAYLSIDLDVIDPAEFPGTGHPEPGGYRLSQLAEAIGQVCRTHRIVGLDIVEATYEEQVNRITGSVMSSVLMACLRSLLSSDPTRVKDAV